MSDALNTIYRYHDETKHRPQRYARSLGFMDWNNQPDPFLKFPETPLTSLPRDDAPGPGWAEALTAAPEPAAMDATAVGRLLYGSLALSAWKEVAGPDGQVVSRWSLRVNPSSGNLHPTEGWLVVPAGLHHYRADAHGLELVRPGQGWAAGRGVLLALSSVVWREAWKYGERAFRYCNHDVGHALAAVTLAAGSLGWRVRALEHVPGAVLAELLGAGGRLGPEGDHPDLLLQLGPPHELADVPTVDEVAALAARLDPAPRPGPLSPSHQPWPIIDGAREAAEWPGGASGALPTVTAAPPGGPDFLPLVRGRRSAVSMDGATPLDADAFFEMCRLLMPAAVPLVHGVLPGPPQVAPVFFVHRVTGLESGLYALPRDAAQADELRAAFRTEAAWTAVPDAPADVPLFQLGAGDLRAHARSLCCQQDIAADGAFTVALLARFRAPLDEHGPGFYPRLFWETGVLGQMLYLGAEAAGVQGTGIGCFFDDETHGLLGLAGDAWQSLYHFTVGTGVVDGRLRTAEAYESG